MRHRVRRRFPKILVAGEVMLAAVVLSVAVFWGAAIEDGLETGYAYLRENPEALAQ